MSSTILLSGPDVGPDEKKAAIRAIQSGWVAPAGPELESFESEISEYLGVQHSVALSSGTAALHLGLLAVGVKPQDVVVTSTMTFVATANAISYTGATPVFVDCLPDGTIDPELVSDILTSLTDRGQSVGAIVPVDLYGRASNYNRLIQVADSFDIPILADSAEALGSSYHGKKIGSLGLPTAFSFNGNKIMTTGGGGLFVAPDANLVERVRFLSTQAREPFAHYEHKELGFNYRLSSVSAAIGRAQLARLPSMIEKRKAIRARYRTLFSRVDSIRFLSGSDDGENCWLTAIVDDSDETRAMPARLLDFLGESGIEARNVWKPMHLQPLYSAASYSGGSNSEQLFSSGVVLPSGSALRESEVDWVEDCLSRFFGI